MARFEDLQTIQETVRELRLRPKKAAAILARLVPFTSEHENSLRMMQAGLVPLLMKMIEDPTHVANTVATRAMRQLTCALSQNTYDNLNVRQAWDILCDTLERLGM